VERLGHRHRVLTGHGVDHEERVVRRDLIGDLPDLRHHLVVDGQTSGRVDDEHVLAQATRLGQTARGRAHRVAGFAEHRNVDLTTEGAQLFDRGRSLQVGAHEERVSSL